MVEIPNQEWDTFCARINELRQQALLTIEVLRGGNQREQIVRELPLQKIELDRSDACNDRIALHLGVPAQRPLTHLIVQPIHIMLRPAENGSFNPLEIDAESGISFLTFHPALRADILHGLKL